MYPHSATHFLSPTYSLSSILFTLTPHPLIAARLHKPNDMQLVFSVAPTLLELFLVSHILYQRCGPVFAGITLTTFSVYLLFTVWITQV